VASWHEHPPSAALCHSLTSTRYAGLVVAVSHYSASMPDISVSPGTGSVRHAAEEIDSRRKNPIDAGTEPAQCSAMPRFGAYFKLAYLGKVCRSSAFSSCY